jgi:hypothetical protein
MAPNMRYIIKLGDDTVPVVWSGKTVRIVHLRREVTQDKHSGGVRAQKDGSHKQLEIFEGSMFTRMRIISMRYDQAEKMTCGLSSESSSMITRSV